jgi:hypothetical protein
MEGTERYFFVFHFHPLAIAVLLMVLVGGVWLIARPSRSRRGTH